MAAAVERIRPRLPRLREQASFTGWLAEIRRTPIRPLPQVDPGLAARIQYTSGTTGKPKGAVLHHHGLVTNAAFTAARAGFPQHGTWVSALPLFHTAGCDLTVLGIAANRGTLVLVQVFQPQLVLDALQKHRADFLGAVPVMLSALLNHPCFDNYDLAGRGQDRRSGRGRSAARRRARRDLPPRLPGHARLPRSARGHRPDAGL
ncbi:AMP-binding protein [Streptomyces lomondensis]|uniref:AMP-dependent synthetase/ligase domain-containing protein n=1 Tax=Streptomyces lomondensis TaxID=68229 RepID=A0ABQ2X3G7_9ACTN|nr:AMP-binding protein [Streptomyces lomondensis]MCF0079969.1 AMP-binding protein [Streptomyces lomondensis]GGW97083.1 hypothetical protein GCM10010383_28620 [Streptomyces lomondensis]